jgi:hypothetical protein
MIKRIILLFICIACSPSSREEYRLEGEDIGRGIVKILQRVHSAGDLKREGPRLKKEYAKLVDLMIAAKKVDGRLEDFDSESVSSNSVSEALKAEFMRVYQLEGCAELMGPLQRESLHKLDLYQKRWEGS